MGEYKDGDLEAVYFGEGRVTLQTDEETEEITTRLEYVLKDHPEVSGQAYGQYKGHVLRFE